MSGMELVKKVFFDIMHMFAVFGLQNIVAIILLLVCLKNIIVALWKKEYMSLIVPGIRTLYLCYSLFTLGGNIRLITMQYGHPLTAYTFPGKIIEKQETDGKFMKYKVKCDTGKTEYDGKRIMPQIDVFKFGPLYYSVIWNSRV